MLFSAVKRYNRRMSSKLPSINTKGIFKDVSLMIKRNRSEACHFFVMGPPRSGTTLARGMIAAHSNVASLDRETFFFLRRRVSLFSSPGIENFSNILKSSSTKVEIFDRIALQIKERNGVNFFLEKTPEHALILDELIYLYPNSKFVLLIRDGRDGYASSFSNSVVRSQLGDNYPYVWRDIARKFLAHENAMNIIKLRYEDLVAFPEDTLKSVMNFLDLPFEPQQLDPHYVSKTSMSRESGHEMLSKSVSAKSVGSYHDRLTLEQIQYFENIAGKELRLLGYSV